MPSDLTERLADAAEDRGLDIRWVPDAKFILPLLLSEPELVASLSDEVRLSVLSEEDWKALMVGRAALRVMESQGDESVESGRRRLWSAVWFAYPRGDESTDAALAEVQALTPEGKDG